MIMLLKHRLIITKKLFCCAALKFLMIFKFSMTFKFYPFFMTVGTLDMQEAPF